MPNCRLWERSPFSDMGVTTKIEDGQDKLLNDRNLNEKYTSSATNRYNELNKIGNSKWGTLKEALLTNEIISMKTKQG